jgi:hypothetical protein
MIAGRAVLNTLFKIEKAIPGCENQVSPIFLVALLYGSYLMSVMFSYCLIGSYLKGGLFDAFFP